MFRKENGSISERDDEKARPSAIPAEGYGSWPRMTTLTLSIGIEKVRNMSSRGGVESLSATDESIL